jgi:hypothetical protein
MLRPLIISACIFLVLALGYIFYVNRMQPIEQTPAVPDITEVETTPLTETGTPVNMTDQQAVTEGIFYDLPESWELVEDSDQIKSQDYQVIAFTTPEGGYFSIASYSYDGAEPTKVFCEIYQDVCLEESTFEPMQIGNMQGYFPKSIDIWGNVLVYFGVSNNKFHIVEISNPEDSLTFVEQYKGVLNSLVFN